jgi:hypothetical protein
MLTLILINEVLQAAVTEFHYNNWSIILYHQILDLGNIWMIELSQVVNFSKNLFFKNIIYVWVKKVVLVFFHCIEFIINFAFDFNDDALGTFVVNDCDGFFIIV